MSEQATYRLTNVAEGSADVVVGGKIVGEVRYHEDRYNLVRVIVNREWWAVPKGERAVKGFATRKEAAMWLATHRPQVT